MNPYLDSQDSYYSYSLNHNNDTVEIQSKAKAKQNRDYAGIAAIIYGFTVIGIVIALSIYTAWNIVYGQQDNQSQVTDTMFANCVKMRIEDMFVLLQTGENCDYDQFSKSVGYYKANGYPHESAYYDIYGVRSIQLDVKSK